MDYKAMLIQALGLPPEATDEQIQAAQAEKTAAMEAMKNRAETAEGQVKEYQKKELEAEVEKDLEAHKGVIKNRAEVKAQLMANREGSLKLLGAIAPASEPAKPASPMMNRKDAKTPMSIAQDVNQEAMRNRAVSDYRKTHKCGFKDAWNGAREEHPELFKS